MQVNNPIIEVIRPSVRASVEFTRPADTIAYSIKDAISNSTTAPTVLTFSGMGRALGSAGYINRIQILTTQVTCTAQLRLHLFNAAPTALADNSPYTTLWARRGSRVGTIDFPALSTQGAGSDASKTQWIDIPVFYVCAAADNALYGMLSSLTAFTPDSGQMFYIALSAEQL